MDKGQHLKVVEGSARTERDYLGKPLRCPKCDSSASIEVRLGRTLKKGRVTGGTKQLRCADCGAIVWG